MYTVNVHPSKFLLFAQLKQKKYSGSENKTYNSSHITLPTWPNIPPATHKIHFTHAPASHSFHPIHLRLKPRRLIHFVWSQCKCRKGTKCQIWSTVKAESTLWTAPPQAVKSWTHLQPRCKKYKTYKKFKPYEKYKTYNKYKLYKTYKTIKRIKCITSIKVKS